MIKIFVDTGREKTAIRLGSDTAVMQFIAIGTGSATVSDSRSGLITEADRVTGTNFDFTVAKKYKYQGDFSSTVMSGLNLKEFATFNLNSGGTAWLVEGFTGIDFDGRNELQIQVTSRTF